MTAGGSAREWGAATRAHARRGVWRPLLSRMGVTVHTRAADAVAARRDKGGEGEAYTARLLAPLEGAGWHIRHDLWPPWRGGNFDHVLTSPDGSAVVVLDTKQWRRGQAWPTTLRGGRVYCGEQDRHEELLKAVKHARQVRDLLAWPAVEVLPLLVVHGSTVAGEEGRGHLDVPVPGLPAPVYVLASDWLVPTLAKVGGLAAADPWRAGEVAARVDQVLRTSRQGG